MHLSRKAILVAAIVLTLGSGGIGWLGYSLGSDDSVSAAVAIAPPLSTITVESTTTTSTTTIDPPTTIVPPTTTTTAVVIVLTSDAELRAVLQGAAPGLIGQSVPEAGVKKFTAQYHAEESQQQKLKASGQTSYSRDPYSQASQFIRDGYPDLVQMQNARRVMNDFNSMLGESGSQSSCKPGAPTYGCPVE